MGHVQRTNPMGICYMYKGSILWGHDAEPDACTEDQSYGTVHVATCTYARSQVKALCQVRRTSYMGTRNAQRVVVKRNTCTEDTYNNTQRVGTSNRWPVQTCITAI